MNIEQIKSWLLTGLVLLSIYLFWNIVTFQENYDHSVTSNQQYIQEITIADKKDPKDIFLPNKLIYRVGVDEYLGTESLQNIKPIIKEISSWTFYDFQEATSDFIDQFNELENDAFILQYPDNIPYEMIKLLFTIEKDQKEAGAFQHIVIFPDDLQKNEGIIYLTNTFFNQAVKVRVRNDHIGSFQDKIEDFKTNSKQYIAVKKNNNDYLFLLNEAISLGNYQYLPIKRETNIFKQALFTDPNIVSQNGNGYTDGSNLLEIYPDTMKLRFVNTTVSLESYVTLGEILQSGIKFINEHSGWTDQYYYSAANANEHKVIFQLNLQDYPVFNESGLSEIELAIGKSGTRVYERPYFALDVPFNPVNEEFTLPTGTEIIHYLENNKGFNINNVDDIVIGYHMRKEFNNELIQLEPTWFYRIGLKWIRISNDQMEGQLNGLE